MKISPYTLEGQEKWLVLSLWILLGLLSLSACVREPLEPEPHVNVFRCKVNGEEWVAYCQGQESNVCEPVHTSLRRLTSGQLYIYAVQKNLAMPINQNLGLLVDSAHIGENPLSSNSWSYHDWTRPGNCYLFLLDTTVTHNLSIHQLDTVNQIIQGTFTFTAIQFFDDCRDTVRVTDGYFHLQYNH